MWVMEMSRTWGAGSQSQSWHDDWAVCVTGEGDRLKGAPCLV